MRTEPNDFGSQSPLTTSRLGSAKQVHPQRSQVRFGVRESARSPAKNCPRISFYTLNITPQSHSTTFGTSEVFFNYMGILVISAGRCNLYQLHLTTGGREIYHHFQKSLFLLFFFGVLIALSFQFAPGFTDNQELLPLKQPSSSIDAVDSSFYLLKVDFFLLPGLIMITNISAFCGLGW